MKLRRTLSGILFGLGCAFTFIGLLALILPCVANDQLRLVLASFEIPSSNPAVSLINSGMSFALRHSWQVLFAGAAALIIGLFLFILFSREKKEAPESYRRPEPPPQDPIWEQPAPCADRPNPFADMALWDQQFAPARRQEAADENPFSAFGGPMLERNRVEPEQEQAYSFSPELYARPAQAVPQEKPAPTEPQVVSVWEARPAPAPLAPPVLDASVQPAAPKVPEKTEPVYTPNEEPDAPVQISSRIRSTMGRHREW